MYIDKRMLYIGIAILTVFGLMGFTQTKLLSLLLTIPGLLIAITFHEFAHAYAADKLGDDTPRMQGRLNLNPINHLDPIGSLLLLFAGFGWGKPVEINSRNFDTKYSPEKAEIIVSIAGPVMNLILAIIFSIIYVICFKFNGAMIYSKIGSIILMLLQTTIYINIGLGVFNLLPLPPLDGSKIFINLMPYNIRLWIQNHEQMFYIIFMIIWVTGLAGIIISPIINLIANGIISGISALFGLI